ncbi:hypothetical protein [Paenibacillus sp. FSL R5-0810]|uniref:hypothetical protein n=1 Tax=Paenibacillus sp. FSL R5-0810 TaxID=2921659 RepID=UPI0030FB9448
MISLEDVNKGDLRVSIDFEEIERNSNKKFADRIQNLKGRPLDYTYCKYEQSDEYFCIYLAVGHYMEKHDCTAHHNIYYCQYHIPSEIISINSFPVDFLNKFNAIGISAPK